MDELAEELSGTTIDEEQPTKIVPQKAKQTKPAVNRYASIINRSKLLILSDSESQDDDTIRSFDQNISNKNQNKNFKNDQSKRWSLYGLNQHESSRFVASRHRYSLRKNGSASGSHGSKMIRISKRKRNSCSTGSILSSSINNDESEVLNLSRSSHNRSQRTTKNSKNDHNGDQSIMEIDSEKQFIFEGSESEFSSDLSDDCPTESNFDGDDEQSDFPDAIEPISHNRRTSRSHHHSHQSKQPKLDTFKIPRPINPFSNVGIDLIDSAHSPSSAHWKRRRANH